MIAKQRVYGTGQLVYVPQTEPGARIPVCSLQNVKLSIKGDITELDGPGRMAEDLAMGKLSIDGSFASGEVRSGLIMAALPGSVLSTGMLRAISQESTGTIAGATYTVQHPTGFVDLAIYDETGKIMTRKASAPAAGEYSVTSGGVFTFNAGANGKVYSVDYIYADAASGWSLDYTNQPQGPAAAMQLYLLNKSKGKEFGALLYSVLMPEFSLALKLGEFTLPEGSFKCSADASDRVCKFWGE
jgi:hypothetical protein